jgi:multiple sugar transport system substrate-binding protein
MSTSSSSFSRREFLKAAGAAGIAGAAPLALTGEALAQAAGVNFFTWSAAVDQVRSHLSAFEKATGVKVNYANAPWAQYRENLITKFVAKAPMDVLWVSDTWLPEWATAGWLAPVNGRPELMKYGADTDPFCLQSMSYKGKQYGLTYYTDYMAFLYDEDKLKKAGIQAPPATWDEVVEQSLKIKKAGLSEYPLMLALAQESWLIEFLTAMTYSFGGRFTADNGTALMADPKRGCVDTLRWIGDAVNRHKIVSPACVETGELNGLRAFTSGNHAFALIAKYRLRQINDPKQSAIGGRARQALMPKGPNGSNATVGWMRFYGMTATAAANKAKADQAAQLIEWFGGKAQGEYRFQKLALQDLGLGFGVKSMFADPEVKRLLSAFGDVDMIQKQQALARKKDTISEWFGEWSEYNGPAWQSAIIGKSTPEAALARSAEMWNALRKPYVS